MQKILYILTITILSTFGLQAQNACDSRLLTANESYKIGDFKKVIQSLENCLEQPKSFSKKSNRENAYVLLASTYIAIDSMSRARQLVEKLIELNPSFQTRNEDLMQFREMIDEAKRGNLVSKVSSVSKVTENLYEAPASVILITAEEIKRRGYLDLEALIHDLPGFDVSRSNGILYSTIYSRGYRSNNTNRMLLLVDGVEENDLWGNIVYLSRQYPISNIKSVEVLYGPASTIYGANAYAGVISINTKAPTEIVKKGNQIGVIADLGYGQWNTRYADATVAIDMPENKLSASFTTRFYQSNEADFSNEFWHDFSDRDLNEPFSPLGDGSTLADLYQHRLGVSENSAASTFYNTYSNSANANYFNLNIDGNGDSSIVLSNDGLNRVLALENELLGNTDYSDATNTGLLAAKVQIGNLKLGWQYWYKEEGVGVWFNDVRQAGTNEGQYWSPTSNFFYARYDTRLNSNTSFTSFTRFKVHGYLESNKLVGLRGYSNGSLKLANLLNEEQPVWSSFALTTRSNQVRHENRLIYVPSERFSIVSGLEVRYSAIQDNYATSSNGSSNAQDHYFFGDAGIYTQVRYQTGELTLTGGLRYDYNLILDTVGYANSGNGYGSQFNPRLAIVYHPGLYVFKAIYATAFKDATNFDRFSTVSGQRDRPNPNLNPEFVQNFELSARRFWDAERRSSIEVLAYFADYSSVIVTRTVDFGNSTTTQFQNSGFRQVFGIQAWADYRFRNRWGSFYGYANYTFTNPRDIAEKGDVVRGITGDTLFVNGNTLTSIRVGDIARHQVNLGINYNHKQLNVHLRTNIMGSRPTGNETTVVGNQETFNPYAVIHGSVSYTIGNTGITVQAIVNNILNTNYYSPGLRDADNWRFSSALPQNGFNAHLRVRYEF